MAYKSVFKRYELKYLLNTAQKERILSAMAPYMELDSYGRTTIRNLYFDTDSFRLIRESIEKPLYKEKLRIRSYAKATPDSTVFVELKKKFRGVVYKRRIALPEAEAMAWVRGTAHCNSDTQIVREIDYFMDFYGSLRPAVYLSYAREAYYNRDGGDFRVTFDDTILCRENALSLCDEPYGTPILPDGTVLMEIKCYEGIPLWMAHTLSEIGIFKTSFSKYGTAYRNLIFPNLKNIQIHTDILEESIYDKLI